MNRVNPISSRDVFVGRDTQAQVLAVDDDRVMLMVLTQLLEGLGHKCLTAANGKEACEIILHDKDTIDAILLDREMPEMDGLQVVEWLKRNPELKRIPVIMQTGSDKPEQIKEGIDAGVFYYLTKPYDESVLESVLASAFRETLQQKLLRSEMQRHKTSFSLMTAGSFTLQSLEEAENLACFLANCFPDADRVVNGLGELLINAVEHGNLAITYEEKTDLIKRKAWRDEVIRRLAMPEFAYRRVTVEFRRGETEVTAVIRDEGNGFDWRSFLNVDPSRAMDNHGRGIAQANLHSFDRLDYNNIGNEVTAVVSLEEELDW